MSKPSSVIARGPAADDPASELHFVHIPKTGGSAVIAAIQAAGIPRGLTLHNHSFRLRDLPPDARAIFFMRDPIGRFVSGFDCRRRQGRPRYDVAWSRAERWAFARFATANALAEALYAGNPLRRMAARWAINSIAHTRLPLRFWLGRASELARNSHRIAFVGDQAALDRDFGDLARLLALPGGTGLSADPVAAHIAPDQPAALSALARRNLRRWYREDFALYRQSLALWSATA